MFNIKSVLKTGLAMIFLGIFVLFLLNFKFTRTNASDSDYNAALANMTQSSLEERKAAMKACIDRTKLRTAKIDLTMDILTDKGLLTDLQIADLKSAKQNLLSEDCYFTNPVQ